jgi:membrane-bound metal-dependent hydrolase YbcI (DUF457 family)
VDPATHALFSLALARGFFPRRSSAFYLAVVLAGTLADLDLLTLLSGPSAYLRGRFTWTHSIVGTFVVIGIAGLVGWWFQSKRGPLWKAGPTVVGAAAPVTSFGLGLLAISISAILHVVLDMASSSGVAALWPLRQTRYAWDILPSTDPWILVLLLAGLLLPELFRLVDSEIGAKDKAPRGRSGALIVLALVAFYVGARATQHGNAVAQLDAHTYRGESPRRLAAFPDSLSLFTWHGVVETTSQICTADVPASSGSRFDPDSAACVHKPEPSPALTTAQQTDAARQFLQAVRFPKASVGSTEEGTEVVLRNVRDAAQQNSRFAPAARVLLNPSGQAISQSIVWASDVRLR